MPQHSPLTERIGFGIQEAWDTLLYAAIYAIYLGETSKFKIPHSIRRMTKTHRGNIGNLFVICMQQVTKGHLYHLLGVSDYYVMYRQRAKSVL